MCVVYCRFALSYQEGVSEAEFDRAVRAHFSELASGQFFDFQSKEEFVASQEKARDFFPEYDDIMMWAPDLRNARAPRMP